MFADHDWKVGDEVLESGGPWHAPRIVKVVRVLKPFIQLEDRTRWSHQGLPYPRQSGHGVSSLTYPVTDDHRADVRRHEIVLLLREARERDDPKRGEYRSHQEWETVPLSVLEKIVVLLP